MKILYVASKNTVAGVDEYAALRKVYSNTEFIDPYECFFSRYIIYAIFYHIHPKILEPLINQYILSKIKNFYDLIIIRNGETIGKNLILRLKKKTNKIIFLCHDNPFVSRDKQRFKLCLAALKYYDLIIFLQSSRIKLSKKYGIKKTLLVLPYYKKETYRPQKITLNEKKKYSNDIIFIGTWMPERGIFFKNLINMGLNLKIYGMRWNKDKNYEFLKSKIKLGNVPRKLYPKLIQCSKIALSIPSQENLDDISGRSIEIPAIGTLLCAKRTKRHEKIFAENKEAIFFSNAKECYRKCIDLLLDANKLKKIAHRGHVKVTKILKTDSESLMKKIITKALDDN